MGSRIVAWWVFSRQLTADADGYTKGRYELNGQTVTQATLTFRDDGRQTVNGVRNFSTTLRGQRRPYTFRQ